MYVVVHTFKFNAFIMNQEKDKYGFRKIGYLYFHRGISGKKHTSLFIYYDPTQTIFVTIRLTSLFLYYRTKNLQDILVG